MIALSWNPAASPSVDDIAAACANDAVMREAGIRFQSVRGVIESSLRKQEEEKAMEVEVKDSRENRKEARATNAE